METVVGVTPCEQYILEVTFSDGAKRHVNVEPLLFGEMFEPLLDIALFRQVTVDKELGTIVWPNGADISPEYLRDAQPEPTPRT